MTDNWTDYFVPANELCRVGSKEKANIIRKFDKTPSDIVCPHFYELNWGYGCPFECAYCYLQGTFHGNKAPRHHPVSQTVATLREYFHSNLEPTVFNSGELADSLSFPHVMEKIADTFEEQNKHKLLLLTKSCDIDFLLKKLRKNTIISFSLNAQIAAERWESKAPPPKARILAGKKLKEMGYEVRVRIDPIFPIHEWKIEYANLIRLLLSNFVPSRVTLGTPRGLQKTILYGKGDRSWINFFSEDSGWGKKIATPLRKSIYEFFCQEFKDNGYLEPIAICKETAEMYKDLKINIGSYPNWTCQCNCTW
jgi:spore photoproduct lyase